MIQIDEPPTQAGCSGCMSPLIWLWSSRRQAWVCFVAGDQRDTLQVHRCQSGQDPPTWRQLVRGDPPSAVYRGWRDQIKSAPRSPGAPATPDSAGAYTTRS